MKIFLICGARPNFMKVAPLVWAMRKMNLQGAKLYFTLVHTGQHYDFNMSDVFFRDLDLPAPDIFLGAGSGTHAEQTARIMVKFEKVLLEHQPDAVVVVGDVNSTMACAITTAKTFFGEDRASRRACLAHVEAGLRSGDRTMPEEINRLVTDSLADVLYVTEPSAIENLQREGVPARKIVFSGNVMVDTLFALKERSPVTSNLRKFGLLDQDTAKARPYGLVTLHRPSNVDDPVGLKCIFDALNTIAGRVPILFPMHPRTRKRMDSCEPTANAGLQLIEPLGYMDFTGMMEHAAFVITDSGGIQEETTALGVPCLTLRENTERPVTVTDGTNLVVGRDLDLLVREVEKILAGNSKKGRRPELWDGHAAERISAHLSNIDLQDFSARHLSGTSS